MHYLIISVRNKIVRGNSVNGQLAAKRSIDFPKSGNSLSALTGRGNERNRVGRSDKLSGAGARSNQALMGVLINQMAVSPSKIAIDLETSGASY